MLLSSDEHTSCFLSLLQYTNFGDLVVD